MSDDLKDAVQEKATKEVGRIRKQLQALVALFKAFVAKVKAIF